MKNIFRTLITAALMLGLTSCYEDYVQDYEEPNMGFAMEKSIRTVISGREPVVYIGVSIGGKRSVDMNDWAKFVIDESLLEGTGMELLPSSYYVLGDQEFMRVRKDNLPVADVKVTLTDAFFADPLSLTNHYVLPFRMTDNSIGNKREGAEYTLPVFKYVSNYSGTYYRMGEVAEVDSEGNEGVFIAFGDTKDIIKCSTTSFTTNAPDVVVCPGLGTAASSVGSLVLTINGTSVSAEGVAGKAEISDFSGKYTKEGEYHYPADFDHQAPQFDLSYRYTSGGKTYSVVEKLVLRQDPLYDLRAASW